MALFTVTVGSGLITTVDEPLALTQVVAVLVSTTEYIPAMVVVKLATLPGGVAPEGTVQAYEYAAALPGTAVTLVLAPEQAAGLFTVTVGKATKVTVPDALALGQEVVVLVIITLYVPPAVVLKLATLPGAGTPAGTVHAYE